jgi:hypothetical protein
MRPAAILLLAASLLAACDSTPVDPSDPRADLAVALFGEDAVAAAKVPMSLPGLVQSSIYRVYSEHGAAAARTVVADLRRLQELTRTASAITEFETLASRQRALHAEQLNLVLKVLGEDVAAAVITAVRDDSRRLHERLGSLTGDGAERPRELLAHVAELIVDAESAFDSGARRVALDAATRAAALIDEARIAVAESRRVPGLDELFRMASRGATGADAAVLDTYRRLQQAAQEEIRAGDRLRAHEALAAVRAEEIRVTLHVLGEQAVHELVARTAHSLTEVRAELAYASGDVSRLDRMAGSASELVERARLALLQDDAALALDLASHAAGLVNTVRLTVDAR